MKTVLFVACLAAVALAGREKRFASATLAASGIGGAAGCVVAGNTLFINGLRQRDLTPAELTELEGYKTKQADYKKELRAAVEQKRAQLKAAIESGKRTSKDLKIDAPKAPEKPSFCDADDTTQYYFDGCMVQNNKVYVGREFVRDLSANEVTELKQFDEKMSTYQKYVQSQVQKQVEGMFGGKSFFGALFGAEAEEATTQAVVTTAAPATEEAPDAPEAPQFCTAIF